MNSGDAAQAVPVRGDILNPSVGACGFKRQTMPWNRMLFVDCERTIKYLGRRQAGDGVPATRCPGPAGARLRYTGTRVCASVR